SDDRIFAVESLPGQFDPRAASCEQWIQILRQGERCRVRNARVYIVSGNITDEDFDRLKSYIINPVESREASLEKPETLDTNYEIPETVETLDGFTDLNADGLHDFIKKYGLAMDYDDIKFCQDYFRNEEERNPTITEIRMIDTYWSDHCRHTTFLTNVNDVSIETPYIRDTYINYLNVRDELGRSRKPVTLMDLATIAARKLKADGLLDDLDESEEINACSVKIKVDVDGQLEDWILMFKNETHNHPTEIEPFGGAATCLGGAIRDPLSGRSYVYQAMRVTGAANPLVPVEDTIAGKLPQRKITVGAANGYSSYGNQIGLATGHVAEVYHPGYVAKRMEIGAVVGAAPAENIRRERPVPSDIVVLLGGKTGRDGCGGATGSSKSNTLESLESCGAEVQKGNPPEERKLQRLFRNPEVTKMIKRCNDFGAGGVSVAIGELTDGLVINLNAVPKKYDGLDGTEIAISESQERMAVVIAPKDLDKFMAEAKKENLEATVVADVVEEPRLKMNWNGRTIVNLSRDFLNSNGAVKYTDIVVEEPIFTDDEVFTDNAETWTELMSNLNVCSQKGLIEKFDSTIGAGTVLMPFGGVYQMTPSQAMAAKIPVLKGETNTCSLMGWGYNPDISSRSPYHGAMLAVVESIAKIVGAGGSYKNCWLTFQEYFERTQNDPK
ncbi:MAG: phosphoribosylformylglycinamidine synthase, partial [Ruminococcus sp.]|nr:phosphoribosylformylglycinamidine synthase [Ruminococcus sp.]